MYCPHCVKPIEIPNYVHRNIESYGSRMVRFRCPKCSKTIETFGQRIVEFGELRKTDKESDWGF